MNADELAAAVEAAVPGAVEAHDEASDMPTLTVRREALVEVCRHLRDAMGRNYLSAVSAVDYLGYGEEVAGYFGTERGRDINRVGSWGAAETPSPIPHRFAVYYHVAQINLTEVAPPERLRLRVWLDDGQSVPSVVEIWPTADWHEREQYDMMGVEFEGHPNLKRLIMPFDWDGHPLRKDYPIGGEPVQFTDAE